MGDFLGDPYIGFIGSFYAYEGLAILLRAIPALTSRFNDVRVVLVGGGPDEKNLKAIARDLGLQDKAIFVGRVPHGEVQYYYDMFDVMVYPRISIRLTEIVTPLKPLEAMARGCLVAASDVGGHRELIRDGKTGVLFRANDPNALADRIGWLLTHPQNGEALRQQARLFVEQERNWPSSVARYGEIYARVRDRSAH